MRRIQNSLHLFIPVVLLFGFSACNEEVISERDYPRINIEEEIEQTDSSITFHAYFLTKSTNILDKGFVWSNVFCESKNSSGSGYGDGTFSGTATYNLTKGNDCSVKAYIVYGDLIIYSKPLSFISNTNGVRHSIQEFQPQSVMQGDTISIYGKNFSSCQYNVEVLFGDVPSKIVTASDTMLRVIVPYDIEVECNIGVNINGYTSQAGIPFRLQSMVIDNFFPGVVSTTKELITINGKGFGDTPDAMDLRIGGFKANIIETSYYQVIAEIPDSIIPDPEVSLQLTVPVEIGFINTFVRAKDSLMIMYKSAWTRLDDFPGPPRRAAIMFSYNG